jgi:hypothetical protein
MLLAYDIAERSGAKPVGKRSIAGRPVLRARRELLVGKEIGHDLQLKVEPANCTASLA